jgi:geranylgeranyl diphosphate synthase type I
VTTLRIDLVGELTARARNHGKRIRPVVSHWGWVAAGGPASGTHAGLVRVAAAMELLHLFALVQDDVMDRSDERRGAPTMHVVAAERHRRAAGLGDPTLFGDSVAILLGDLALSEATLLVADAQPPVRRLWRRMTAELVQGQLLDVTQAASRQRGLPAVRRIARLKSGRYTITRPLQLGALVAGAPAGLVDRLEHYGDLVGDAFAVRDDILGVWGDPARTGKPAGDDLRSGKPTLLLALAHQHLPASQRHLLHRCDAGQLDDADGAARQQALVDCGVREIAECLVQDLMTSAADDLERLDIDPAAVPGLQQLADTIAWRDA